METSRKLAKYDRLYDQIKQYIQTTEDIWARLATMEAVLHHKMQSFFWTGVYVLIDGDLIVRSYQGPVACQKLRNGGVCWAAINSGACNAASKSEIVIPLRDPEGRIFGCLDVDSDQLGAFDREDEAGLKKILSLLYQSDSVK